MEAGVSKTECTVDIVQPLTQPQQQQSVTTHVLPALHHEHVDLVRADRVFGQSAAAQDELINLRVVLPVIRSVAAVSEYLPHQYTCLERGRENQTVS